MEFLEGLANGQFLAILGASIAIIFAGMGSAKGTSLWIYCSILNFI